MKENKRTFLIVIILLIAFYALISIIPSFFKEKEYTNTVFIGSNTKITVNKNNIKVYNDNKNLRKQKVKAYFNEEFIDVYIFSEEGDTEGIIYNISDENDNVMYPTSALLAHTKDLTLKVLQKNTRESSDLTEVYNFTQNNNIILPDNIVLDYMIINNLDIDSDGNSEYIYSVGLIKDEYEYDSFVFMIKDNKYILIAREESDYIDEVSNIRLTFFNNIDFDNDGIYEFVVSKMMSEYGPNYYEVYSFNGNTFTELGGE